LGGSDTLPNGPLAPVKPAAYGPPALVPLLCESLSISSEPDEPCELDEFY